MRRWVCGMTLLCATLGCAAGPGEPTEGAFDPSSPAAFAGAWRSVTPSLEFVGLTVASKSSEMGMFGARLTLSGVAWEGSGRIEGDSLVAGLTVVGVPTANSVIVARARDGRTLGVRFRAGTASPLDLTFVRED